MDKGKNSTSLGGIQNFLDSDNAIELAILFGSFATGTQRIGSDIDLAIQLHNPLTAEQKLSYLEKLQGCTDVEVDLVDLRRAGQPLLSQIMKYGELLKGDSHHYAELAIRNINTATDFLPYVRRMMRERRERLLNG